MRCMVAQTKKSAPRVSCCLSHLVQGALVDTTPCLLGSGLHSHHSVKLMRLGPDASLSGLRFTCDEPVPTVVATAGRVLLMCLLRPHGFQHPQRKSDVLLCVAELPKDLWKDLFGFM